MHQPKEPKAKHILIPRNEKLIREEREHWKFDESFKLGIDKRGMRKRAPDYTMPTPEEGSH